jgi:hypothetical protein
VREPDDDCLPGRREGNLCEQADEHVLVLFRIGVELPRSIVGKFDGPRVGDGPKFVISLLPLFDCLDSAIKIDVF